MIVLQHEDLWTNLQGGHIGVLQVDSRDNGGGGSMNVIRHLRYRSRALLGACAYNSTGRKYAICACGFRDVAHRQVMAE